MAIILYCGGPQFDLPEVSPFVTKTEIHLQMAGLTYRKEPAFPESSPKGQLPWIDDDGERVADSTFIRMHIERKYGIDLDAGLDDLQRAQAWAIERMIEDHLRWIAGWCRFLIPANFDKGPAHWFDRAPDPIRDELKQNLLRQVGVNLKAVGITRHNEDEIVGLGFRSLAALSRLLDGQPYVMGGRKSAVDAIAFGVLAAILTPFFDSALRRRAAATPTIVAFVERMMGEHYPHHSWPTGSQSSDAIGCGRPT